MSREIFETTVDIDGEDITVRTTQPLDEMSADTLLDIYAAARKYVQQWVAE